MAKHSRVVRDLPRVGVTEDGEVQVIRDEAGDIHVYAKSTDDILVHRKKPDSGKVASLCNNLWNGGAGGIRWRWSGKMVNCLAYLLP